MSVITSDILIEGIRRDDVFAWLSEPANHSRFMDGAYDGFKQTAVGEFDLTLATPGKTRTMGYRFRAPDDSHGGRRVLCETTGKRTSGSYHYSLRTMKPSSNTLITLHMDYDPGSMLGAVIDSMHLKGKLQDGAVKVLENLARELKKG